MAKTIEGYKLAADLAKQIITLSTAVVTVTVTFAKEFKTGAALSVPVTLQISWLCAAFAIIFALWTLMSITGTLIQRDRELPDSNVTDSNIRLPAFLMISAFLASILLTMFAGSEMVR